MNLENFQQEKKEKYEKIYLPFADTRGEIDAGKASSTPNQWSSALELTIDPKNPNRAYFRIMTEREDMCHAAVMSYDQILLPIAEIKSEEFRRVDGNFGKLIVQEPGILKKVDNRWIIEKKAKVKTEINNEGVKTSDTPVVTIEDMIHSRTAQQTKLIMEEPQSNKENKSSIDATKNLSSLEEIQTEKEEEKEYAELEVSLNHKDKDLEQKVKNLEDKIDRDFLEIKNQKAQTKPEEVEKQASKDTVTPKALWDGKNIRSTEITRDIPYEKYVRNYNTLKGKETNLEQTQKSENTFFGEDFDKKIESIVQEERKSLHDKIDKNVDGVALEEARRDAKMAFQEMNKKRRENAPKEEYETSKALWESLVKKANNMEYGVIKLEEENDLPHSQEQSLEEENLKNLNLSKDAEELITLRHEKSQDSFIRKEKTPHDIAKELEKNLDAAKQKEEDERKTISSKNKLSEREQRNILEKRRFGHYQKIFDDFAKENPKNEAYTKLKEVFDLTKERDENGNLKGYDILNEDQKALIRTFNFKKLINERGLEKEQKEKLVLKKERIEILDKRIRSLENTLLKQEGKGLLRRSWARFTAWYEKPENKKKLYRRALISGGVATGLMLTGVGTVGLVGATAARFVGSYAGGETARWFYDQSKKDYRERMVDFRNEVKRSQQEFKEKWNIENHQYQDYKQHRDKLLEDSAGYIQNKNKWRTRIDTAGRILGGFSLRGIEEIFAENGGDFIPEEIETSEPVNEEIETSEPVAVEQQEDGPQNISKDIFINKGEGITHALLRQLHANADLRETFGIEGNATGSDAARIAKEFGYINEDGSEVRVYMGQGAGYELTFDEQGNPIVREYKGGEIKDDFYEGGEKIERHMKGSPFEGNNIEEYEYLHTKKGLENTPLQTNTSSGINTSSLEGVSVPNNENLFSEHSFPGRVYPGHMYLQPGIFDENFKAILGDQAVAKLFEQHGIPFTQENFEKLGFRHITGGPRATHFINIHDETRNYYGWKDIYERFNIAEAKEKYFNTAPSYSALGAVDVPLNETIENNVEEVRTQAIGPFNVSYDGNIQNLNQNFKFDGPIDNEFSNREMRLIEKGKMEKVMVINDNRFGIFNNTHMVKLTNGQYALEMGGNAKDAVSSQSEVGNNIRQVLNSFGMQESTARHYVTQPLEGTEGYSTRIYVPLSDEQARLIGTTFYDIGKVLENRS